MRTATYTRYSFSISTVGNIAIGAAVLALQDVSTVTYYRLRSACSSME